VETVGEIFTFDKNIIEVACEAELGLEDVLDFIGQLLKILVGLFFFFNVFFA
jgi:hypothetical protein